MSEWGTEGMTTRDSKFHSAETFQAQLPIKRGFSHKAKALGWRWIPGGKDNRRGHVQKLDEFHKILVGLKFP